MICLDKAKEKGGTKINSVFEKRKFELSVFENFLIVFKLGINHLITFFVSRILNCC